MDPARKRAEHRPPAGPHALLSVADIVREYLPARTFYKLRQAGLVREPLQITPGMRGQRWYRHELEADLEATRKGSGQPAAA